MRKLRILLPLILLGLVMLYVPSCGRREPELHNQISQMRLTDEQQKIVDLISTINQEVYLFEFNTTEPFTGIEIRLEAYEYGELAETQLGFAALGFDYPLNGNIAVVINEDRYNGTFRWAVTISDGGGSASGQVVTTPVAEGMRGRAFSAMNNAVTISNGTEAVLFVSKFTNDGFLEAGGDLQNYLDSNNFARYPLVQVLIASFTQ